mgnify:CR=1 FL=1
MQTKECFIRKNLANNLSYFKGRGESTNEAFQKSLKKELYEIELNQNPKMNVIGAELEPGNIIEKYQQ